MEADWTSTVTDLPVILQGALGSALFALAFWGGQRAFRAIAGRAVRFKRSRRIEELRDQIVKLGALQGADIQSKAAFVSLLLYRALRNVTKGLVWLTFGLITSTVIPVFATAGYVGALYFFFVALNTLRGIDQSTDIEARLSDATTELTKLDGSA